MDIVKFLKTANYTSKIMDEGELIKGVSNNVKGFCSSMIMKTLSDAVSCLYEDQLYLEVGVFEGRTLIGAMVENTDKKAIAIDNFSEFTADIPGSLKKLKENIQKYNLEDNICLYQMDYFAWLKQNTVTFRKKVGVLFYDGCHNTEETYNALMKSVPLLANQALIFIDDTSSSGVWRAVDRFLHSSYKNHTHILFSLYTPDFPNSSPVWHNGLTVIGWQSLPYTGNISFTENADKIS